MSEEELKLFLRIYVEIPIEIEVKTGLFIGGLESDIADNPIIKDKEGFPYIPGSSLKGRIRSILEFIEGKIYVDKLEGYPRNPENYYKKHKVDVKAREIYDDKIARTFGYAPKDKRVFGPTRIIFEDFKVKKANETPFDFIELKIENMIDRVKGQAKNPRIVERVIPGTKFEGRVKIIGFDVKLGDNYKCAKDEVLEAIELLAKGLAWITRVGLGGKISRGYGQVEVRIDEDKINVYVIQPPIEECKTKTDLKEEIIRKFRKRGVIVNENKQTRKKRASF